MSNNFENYWQNQSVYNSFYNSDENMPHGSDDANTHFHEQLDFQTVDPSVAHMPIDPNYSANPFLQPNINYSGSIYTPSMTNLSMSMNKPSNDFSDYDNEPPLLEELGINPDHILQKTLLVLNPFRETNIEVLQDNDLAGPLVFCLMFGAFLLLSGKLQFSYIYGIGVIGSLAMYFLLYEMAISGVTLMFIISVLGYCILPMAILSGISIILSLQGISGTLLTIIAIIWCSISSSKLFVSSLSMTNQLLLITYPCALLYSVFALITIF